MDASLLLFLISLTGFLEASHCPPVKGIAPCKCISHPFIEIVCENIFNAEEFIAPMQTLANSGTHVSILRIRKSSLPYLPENVFQDTHITKVDISMSEIISLSEHDTAFKGLEHILIEFTAAFITTAPQWDFNQLRNLHKLELIILTKVNLDGIDHPFPHLPRLSRLDIRRCELTFVSDDAFSNLPKLKFFELTDNDVKEVKRSMFPNPANDLYILNLRRNKLTYLPKDFFDNMPSLRNLYLGKNRFTTLKEEPFSVAFKNLYNFQIEENPLRCDCRMRWLVNVRFPTLFSGECSSPAALSGRSIKDLDLHSLWC